jgi:hypothetical protein
MATNNTPTTNSNGNPEAHQKAVMTPEEWKRTPRDYKTIDRGQRYVLRMVPGRGTCLVPVEIVRR